MSKRLMLRASRQYSQAKKRVFFHLSLADIQNSKNLFAHYDVRNVEEHYPKSDILFNRKVAQKAVSLKGRFG